MSRRSATTSTTMIGFAPASTAPWTADRPTPPAPKMTTASPAHSPMALSTAPTPVMTAQPAMAAISGGTPSGTGTTARSEHHGVFGEAGDAEQVVDLLAVGAEPGGAVEQPAGADHDPGGLAQGGPSDQAVAALAAPRPPHQADAVARLVAGHPGPTASITPVPSWPGRPGGGT